MLLCVLAIPRLATNYDLPLMIVDFRHESVCVSVLVCLLPLDSLYLTLTKRSPKLSIKTLLCTQLIAKTLIDRTEVGAI